MAPMPPESLRHRVSGLRDPDQFDGSGRLSVGDFSRALAGLDRPFSSFEQILEWGCGCGRILRHVETDPTRQQLHGCDIDAEAIGWLQANMPNVKAATTEGLPPLPYGDAQFDLIFNHSVLTHLNEDYQNAWLAELRRVLAQHGVLILTVHGSFAHDLWAAGFPADATDWQKSVILNSYKAVDEKGFYFFEDNGWTGVFPKYYQTSFHSASYVFEHWGQYFDIACYIPRGSLRHQDMIVLQHKDPNRVARTIPQQVVRRPVTP